MKIEELTMKLLDYGKPVVVKDGLVLTVVMLGNGLSKWETVIEIQKLILEFAGEKYPSIEVFKNDDEYLVTVLKPKVVE